MKPQLVCVALLCLTYFALADQRANPDLDEELDDFDDENDNDDDIDDEDKGQTKMGRVLAIFQNMTKQLKVSELRLLEELVKMDCKNPKDAGFTPANAVQTRGFLDKWLGDCQCWGRCEPCKHKRCRCLCLFGGVVKRCVRSPI